MRGSLHHSRALVCNQSCLGLWRLSEKLIQIHLVFRKQAFQLGIDLVDVLTQRHSYSLGACWNCDTPATIRLCQYGLFPVD